MLRTILLLPVLTCCALADFRQHYRYNEKITEPSPQGRTRRQVFADDRTLPNTQIDLNITVPFIFSARLYPYSSNKGDMKMKSNTNVHPYNLKHSIKYLDNSYSTLYIMRDGALAFGPGAENSARVFPNPIPMIAVYWAPASLTGAGNVYFRETEDPNVLSLAESEVRIQYRHGQEFKVKSVVIVTWEFLAPADAQPNLRKEQRNVFQISIINSEDGTFAHMVYSKLRWNDNAVAGFNAGGDGSVGPSAIYSLPGSGTADSILLANQSDIGIPGEWLFRIDAPTIYLCGPGFSGLECIEQCASTEWFYDCSKQCNCEGGAGCHAKTGVCSNGKCKGGWTNAPICDIDIDECANAKPDLCPWSQPDCVNTPGAFLCMCLSGYDKETKTCISRKQIPVGSKEAEALIPVHVVNVEPQLVGASQGNTRVQDVQPSATTKATTAAAVPPSGRRKNYPKLQFMPPRPRVAPVLPRMAGGVVVQNVGFTAKVGAVSVATLASTTTGPGTNRPFVRVPVTGQDGRRVTIAGQATQQQGARPRGQQTVNLANARAGQVLSPVLFTPPPIFVHDPEKDKPKSVTRGGGGGLVVPPRPVSRPEGLPESLQPSVRVGSSSEPSSRVTPISVSIGGGISPTSPFTGQSSSSQSTRGSTSSGSSSSQSTFSQSTATDLHFLNSITPPIRQQTHQAVAASTPRPIGSSHSQGLSCDVLCGEHAHCELDKSRNGEPRCFCDAGWSGDGLVCVDVNECFVENACLSNSRCQNTLGGYSCLCDDGYVSDGQACVDYDECADELVQCPGGNSSLCVNTVGSYQCKCADGYNGEPSSILGCIDVNECLVPEFYCGANADCENRAGGYICHCFAGFARNPATNKCDDIDECLTAPCAKAASCSNTVGSFKCKCLPGYAGDGFACDETILFPVKKLSDTQMSRKTNAVKEYPLSVPMEIYGMVYNHIYISSNGIVSFDQPFENYTGQPMSQMGSAAFSPLYIPTDLSKGGGVYYREETDPDTLARASLNVQENFKRANFRAQSLFTVTFDEVRRADSDEMNTYQMIFIRGENETFVMYLYDRIDSALGMAGLSSPFAGGAVDLPGSGVSANRLREMSNVGQPGKWLFRIDDAVIVQCPSGKTHAPLCDKSCDPGLWGDNCENACNCANDIPCDFSTGFCTNQCQLGFSGDNCQNDVDECESGTHDCDPHSLCTNTFGSYTCQCFQGYTGSGNRCQEIDSCTAAFGFSCSPDAVCLLDLTGKGHCVCTEGYTGDGFKCTLLSPSASSLLPDQSGNTFPSSAAPPGSVRPSSPTTGRTQVTPQILFTSRVITEEEVAAPTHRGPTDRPFVNNWLPDDRKTSHTVGSSTVRPPFTVRKPNRPRPPPTNTVEDDTDWSDNNLLFAGHDSAFDSDDTSNMLVIIIPAALCGIWLILIVVLLAVCLRRRRLRQEAKYGMNFYSAAGSNNNNNGAGSIRSSNSKEVLPANPLAVPYGSQWSLPRGGAYADYYTGTYYPNPYGRY